MASQKLSDPRYTIRDSLLAEIGDRWPELRKTTYDSRHGDGTVYPSLQLGMPEECGYGFIHITFHDSIGIDADGDYGPIMSFSYDEPDSIDNTIAFVLAILSSRRSGDGQRLYTAESNIDLTEWRKLI